MPPSYAVAMPRMDEVRALLAPLEQEDVRLDVIAEDAITETQVHVRYQTYLAGFTEYIDWRDDQMDEGIDVLRESDSSSTLAETLNRQWSDFFLARGRDAADRLNRLADNVDFHAPALRARSRSIVTEETQFWAQLAAAPLAQTAGELVHRRYELATEQERLADKWEALGDQTEDLSEKTARATTELTKVLREVVEQIVAEQRGLVSKVEGVRLDPSALIKDWQDALVALLKAAATVIFTATERIKGSTESYLRDLTNLHQQTEGVAVLFVQMRDDVRRFLEPRRLQIAKALFESAAAASRDAVGRCPTAEQRADALAVIERAIDEVEPIIDEFELAFEVVHRRLPRRVRRPGRIGDDRAADLRRGARTRARRAGRPRPRGPAAAARRHVGADDLHRRRRADRDRPAGDQGRLPGRVATPRRGPGRGEERPPDRPGGHGEPRLRDRVTGRLKDSKGGEP